MMKTWTSLVVALGLVSFAGCKKKQEEQPKPAEPAVAPKPTEPPPPEAPKPLVGAELAAKYQSCVALVSGNKLEEFRKECVADDYMGHPVAGNPEIKGGDALVSFMKDMKTSMPDWKLEPQLVVVNGRNILAVNLMTGTHSGPMKSPAGEVPATNKKVGLLMFHRLAINEANKASGEWVYADQATMMGQLGLAPKGTPPTRPAMDKGIEGAPIVVITADDDKERANLETTKKAYDAFNARKLPDLMALYTDDAVEFVNTEDKDRKGKKEIEKGLAEMQKAFSNGKVSNLEMWAGGDYVVAAGKFEGTNDKDFGKIKKTGKPVAIDFAQIVQVKDGKAAKIWRFSNGIDWAMQLGTMPAAAPGGAAPGAAPPGGAPPAGDAKPGTKPGDAKPGDKKAPAKE